LGLSLVHAIEFTFGQHFPLAPVVVDPLLLGIDSKIGFQVDQRAHHLYEVLLFYDFVHHPEGRALQVVADVSKDCDAHYLDLKLVFVEAGFPLLFALLELLSHVDFDVFHFLGVIDEFDKFSVQVVDEFSYAVPEVGESRTVIAKYFHEVEENGFVADEGVGAQTGGTVRKGFQQFASQFLFDLLNEQQILEQHDGLGLSVDGFDHELVVPAFGAGMCLHVQFLYQRMLLNPRLT